MQNEKVSYFLLSLHKIGQVFVQGTASLLCTLTETIHIYWIKEKKVHFHFYEFFIIFLYK